MTTCKDCEHFFPLETDPGKGDCIQKVVDRRQAYHKAKPVAADRDATACSSFQKK